MIFNLFSFSFVCVCVCLNNCLNFRTIIFIYNQAVVILKSSGKKTRMKFNINKKELFEERRVEHLF